MNEETQREMPSYEETVILVNQNRLALQGMSIAVNELRGAVSDLTGQLSALIDAIYGGPEAAEEVVEAELVEPVE